MTRTFLCLVALLVSNSAKAEMLLAEIGWQQPEPITLPAFFDFNVVDPDTGHGASISTSLTSPDQTMAMTIDDHPTSVALFNRVLAENNSTLRRAYITNDGQITSPPFGHVSFDAIWFPDNDPNDRFHATAHVPQLSNPGGAPYWGLFGYWLSSVKQVVTPAGQTVYFYGNLIPEPSTGMLMLLGCFCFHLSRWCRPSIATSGRLPRP